MTGGYFIGGVIYVLVPTASLTLEMLNQAKKSFYVTGDLTSNSLTQNNDQSTTIVKVKEPVSTEFAGYTQLNSVDIENELAKAEWQPSV